MNLTYYKIELLKDLIAKLEKKGCNQKEERKKVQYLTSIEHNKKHIIIGFIEIKMDNNNRPVFCFNDNTASIQCQLLNFNECWLSNILYTDSWNLIQYDTNAYYLEINSFFNLMENINLMEYFEINFQENFKSFINRSYVKVPIISREKQEKLFTDFKNIIFPMIKDNILSNSKSSSIQNKINIISYVRSKSSLQKLVKSNNVTLFFFIIEVIIEPFETQYCINENYISAFIIFQTSEIDNILINYHKLQVKKTYIFQNLLIKLLKQNTDIYKNIFQFVTKTSSFEEFLVLNKDTIKINENRKKKTTTLNLNTDIIDLTKDDSDCDNNNIIDLTINEESDNEENDIQYNIFKGI